MIYKTITEIPVVKASTYIEPKAIEVEDLLFKFINTDHSAKPTKLNIWAEAAEQPELSYEISHGQILDIIAR